jgi:hypothetical protein
MAALLLCGHGNGHCCVDRAKMGQAMRSQSQFCVDLLPGEYATAGQPADDQGKRLADDRGAGQRLDRLRRRGIESARQRGPFRSRGR